MMSRKQTADSKRGPWALGFDWFCFCAVLPMAVPLILGILFNVLAAHNDSVRDFISQGDFLLATTVLAAAVGYDISEARVSGRPLVNGRFVSISLRILWVVGIICCIYYVVLKTVRQFAPTLVLPDKLVYFGIGVYVCTAVLSMAIKSSLYDQGLTDE
ncbi:hypothetical protein [Xanthomonas sp. NCPPB 2632]|uniref:hypothetical protein n=1 Tax=Xanthomonas sp. NCPPB 2632 TaxID=3240912 RepID=UPI0035172E21